MADITENEKTGRIRIAGVKLFADGSVSGRTAWVNEPYQDGTTGLSTLTPAAIPGSCFLRETKWRAAGDSCDGGSRN